MKRPKEVPKNRRRLDLSTKLKALQAYDVAKTEGQTLTSVATQFGISKQAFSKLISKRERIERTIAMNPTTKVKALSNKRHPITEVVEANLLQWIQQRTTNSVPISKKIVQTVAQDIHQKVQDQFQVNVPFAASSGWFSRFCARSGLRSVKLTGESALVDIETVDYFKAELGKMIQTQGYSLDQVWNVDEAGVYWKLLPETTYAGNNVKTVPGFKSLTNRVTVLVGGNASGDMKIKPMVINNYLNPRPLNKIDKSKLGVIFRASKKAWMTGALFQEWFDEFFAPAVKVYLEGKNKEPKALLILDNAAVHPQDLNKNHPEIKVIFMPPNCSCLIQPMDQAPIKCFKSYYIRRTARLASQCTTKQAFYQFWKTFTIKDFIEHFVASWDEVKSSTMRKSWHKLLPKWCREGPQQDLQEAEEMEKTVANSATETNQLVREWLQPLGADTFDPATLTEEQEFFIRQNLDIADDDGDQQLDQLEANADEALRDHCDYDHSHNSDSLKFLDEVREAITNGRRVSMSVSIN